jgi:hypothetical protein
MPRRRSRLPSDEQEEEEEAPWNSPLLSPRNLGDDSIGIDKKRSGSSPRVSEAGSSRSSVAGKISLPPTADAKNSSTVSLPVVVQAFLVVAIAIVVLSISLCFRFLSVVAMEKVGGLYFDAAAAGVSIQMKDFLQQGSDSLTFISYRLRNERMMNDMSQVCALHHRSRDTSFRMLWNRASDAQLDFTLSWYGVAGADALSTPPSSGGNSSFSTLNLTWCSCWNWTSQRDACGAPLESWNFQAPPPFVTDTLPNGTLSSLTMQQQTGIRWGGPTARAAGRPPPSSASPLQDSGARLLLRLVIQESFIQNILTKYYSTPGSTGITAYLVQSASTDTVLVESYQRRREEAVLLTDSAATFDLGVDGLDWKVAVEAGNSIVTELRRGTYVVVVIALSIALAVAVAAIVLLRVVLTPLGKLRMDMMSAAQLHFDSLPLRQSIIREIDDMARSFAIMVTRLKAYKPMLTELLESRSRRSGSTFSPKSGGNSATQSFLGFHSDEELEDDEEDGDGAGIAHTHLLRVTVRYLSRRQKLEKGRVTFEHSYRDGDPELLDRFILDCLTNLGLSKFEVAGIHVESRGSQVHVVENRQLEQLISTCPGEMNVVLTKTSVKTLLSPFSLFIDLCNFALNLAIIFGTVFLVQSNRSQRLSVYLFAGLYAFAFAVNVPISLWCLKRGQRDPKFKEWLSQAGLEVSVMLLLCMLNTQHVHFLWSHWSFFGILNFNAPRPLPLWKMCVRWSMFGFVFIDLMQLFYKVFRLWNEEPLSTITGIALATSALSIALALPKKVTFFAMSRKPESEEKTESFYRQRTSGNASLTSHEVTLLLFRLFANEKDNKKVSHRLALECSAFYNAVLTNAKRCEGTILFYHGTDVLVIFNAPRPVENHAAKAISCAFSAFDALKQYRVRCAASVTTDVLPVGMLGSTTRKTYQVCSPSTIAALSRLVDFGLAAKMQVIATKKTIQRLEVLALGGVASSFLWTPFPVLSEEIAFSVTLVGSSSSATQKSKGFNLLAPENIPIRTLPAFGFVSDVLKDEEDIMTSIGQAARCWMEADNKADAFASLQEQERGNGAGGAGAVGDVSPGSDRDLLASSGTFRSASTGIDGRGPVSPQGLPAATLPSSGAAPSPQQTGPGARPLSVGFVLGHVLRPRSCLPDVEL